jgi:spermidine synthase
LMAFQIMFGSLYFEVGVIVTTFMLGLVIGAALINRQVVLPLWCRRPACIECAGETPAPQRDRSAGGTPAPQPAPQSPQKSLVCLALAIALFAACLPPLLIALGRSEWCAAAGLPSSVAGMAIPLLTLLLAVLVGMEFPLAARIDYRDAAATSSRYYTADYIGAALGALLVSTWLIPVLGVTLVCLLTAGLNLIAAGVLLIARR